MESDSSGALSEDPQAERKELLVCPVEGGGEAQIERDRTLLEDGSGEGGRDLDRDPEADQRRSGESEKITWTFAKFCEVVYLPVCHRKWKASTDMVEPQPWLEVHLVPAPRREVDAGHHEK